MDLRRIVVLVVAAAASTALLYALHARLGDVPPLGTLLDPADGLYRSARAASLPGDSTRLTMEALDAPVTIVRDARAVPHIFAESDRDAIIALGYVVARDRLFQLDFIPRVASGRLAEAFGPGAVRSDRFLRRTGMEWGAQKNLRRIESQDGLELDLIEWYGAGVNAYLDGLDPADLPFEFRLLGYTPDRFTPIQSLRLLQYMTYDLTYRSDAARYALVRDRLSEADYATLYPNEPAGLYEPIIPSGESDEGTRSAQPASAATSARGRASAAVVDDARAVLRAHDADRAHVLQSLGAGFRTGKGSNNWAVSGARSETGAPLLAGDMHLSLSLPPIWYEVHLVTPTMNTYGLTVPGAPVLAEAFNDHVGWTFTNTGADQIDHYALEVDSARTRYRFEGEWRPLERVVDTIAVNGAPSVVDTFYYSHHGPVRFRESDETNAVAPRTGALAERWVAHDSSRTLRALWAMNHATDLASFEEGLRMWDTPMQNVLYAGTDGHIAIRSTGYLPVRRGGHGRGLLDGTSREGAWTGRVPFDSLPYARDPSRGYLTSSNQKPTGPDYPYYLGHDWRDGWRSLRIDSLLSGSARHGVDDFKRYHADVDVQQRDAYVPLLDAATDLSPRADTLRAMLKRWDGVASLDRPEPLVLDVFLERLEAMTWDESVFENAPTPEAAPLIELARTNPTARWFDVQSTDVVEDAPALWARALEATADTLAARHGWDRSAWRWGDHHAVVFRHLTQSDALRPLGRGPFPYPGFASTVSPARGRTTTHSASQRVIVDFSTDPPSGIGVVPGGQLGNPLSPAHYDTQLPAYVQFRYYDLLRPQSPSDLPADSVAWTTTLTPRPTP